MQKNLREWSTTTRDSALARHSQAAEPPTEQPKSLHRGLICLHYWQKYGAEPTATHRPETEWNVNNKTNTGNECTNKWEMQMTSTTKWKRQRVTNTNGKCHSQQCIMPETKRHTSKCMSPEMNVGTEQRERDSHSQTSTLYHSQNNGQTQCSMEWDVK